MRVRAVLLATMLAVLVYGSTVAQPPTPLRVVAADLFEPVPEPQALPTLFLPTPSPRPSPTALPPAKGSGGTPPRATARPTPKPSRAPKPVPPVRRTGHRLAGRASYYCCTSSVGDGYYGAAGPALRIAMGGSASAAAAQPWRGKVVHVCGPAGCQDVRLVDWCQCSWRKSSEKIIDLEPAAMHAVLGDYYESLGVAHVTITW